ncbi:MAG TPA: hypothetical protein VF175_10235 [Lacipirellula sp.]
MRFSLKWILIAAVYFAVGAAALTQQSWVYADVLWVMTALSLVLAALLAVYMCGRGRTVATGFLLAAAGYMMYSMLTPTFNTVTSRILLASGYDPGGGAIPGARAGATGIDHESFAVARGYGYDGGAIWRRSVCRSVP